MSPTQTSSFDGRNILPNFGHFVKGRIVAAGISMGRLAREAEISQPSLSNIISGRRRSPAGRQKIYSAFARLTGSRMTYSEFWFPMTGNAA